MKKICLFFLFLIVISFECYSKETTTSAVNTIDISMINQDALISEQVLAWQDFARVIYPNLTDDTEGKRAAEIADSIGNEILNNKNLSVIERKAKLLEMENYIAYGMNYFVCIIGIYQAPEVSEAGLRIISTANYYIDKLRESDFKDLKTLMEWETMTYWYFYAFMAMNELVQNAQTLDVYNMQFNYRDYNDYIDKLYLNLDNKEQAYRNCVLIENSLFYMTFVPLTFWNSSIQFQERYQTTYNEIAYWFDEITQPIVSNLTINNFGSLKEIDFHQFLSIEQKAITYKCYIINNLTKVVKERGPIE